MDKSSRGLRYFVDIRKGEAEPAALFFSFWFLVIVVFQALRSLKKALFVEYLGPDVELYAKLANIGVAILAVVVFTALYNRFGSRRLIPALCGLFIVALLGFASALALLIWNIVALSRGLFSILGFAVPGLCMLAGLLALSAIGSARRASMARKSLHERGVRVGL